MTDFTIRSDCRLCSGPIREVLRLPDTPLANELVRRADLDGIPTDRFEAAGRYFTRETGQDKFPLYLAQCETCGHVQLPVVVDPKRLFPPDYPYQSGTSPVFRAHLKEFAATVSGMIPKGGKVLEIASNDGTLLTEFLDLGHDAIGVDPAASSFEERNRASVRTIRAFFTSQWARALRWGDHGATSTKVDAIAALNVFAHVDDLNDFTSGVAELLAPDGVFVFEVGYWPEVVRNGLLGCVYHEHVSYHHLWPLLGFFEDRHGLTLFDAEQIDSQGGSVRCFVRRGRSVPSPRLRKLLARTAEQPSTALLQAQLDAKRAAISDRIRAMRGASKSVAAFGAPAKLTTWSYALGLGPDDITKVYDDNPLKQGRLTPGNLWPIVPSAQLLEDQPDAVLLFSSNFEAEIRERFKGYRGEWIVV